VVTVVRVVGLPDLLAVPVVVAVTFPGLVAMVLAVKVSPVVTVIRVTTVVVVVVPGKSARRLLVLLAVMVATVSHLLLPGRPLLAVAVVVVAHFLRVLARGAPAVVVAAVNLALESWLERLTAVAVVAGMEALTTLVALVVQGLLFLRYQFGLLLHFPAA
jgi:hypothetical protein